MNFKNVYKQGQKVDSFRPIPLGEGLEEITKAINGIQPAKLIGVAASPKAGKSTFVDYAMVIQPYLYALVNNVKVNWIYFSFEIDRVSKEFDFACYFLYKDYGIDKIILPQGITKDGKNFIELSSEYLMGRLLDDKDAVIKVNSEVFEKLKIVYEKRIIPLFGEFDEYNNCIKPGLINFISHKDNPTGIYKTLKQLAATKGKFLFGKFGKVERITGYVPNEEVLTIVVIDHLRKLLLERGFTMKSNVDKMLEYCVELRDWCKFTFVCIIHTNRGVTDVARMQYAKDLLYPTSDDVKDSGNLAEDCNYLFTLFNPNDERYRLTKHFGVTIKDNKGNPFFPDMRTIHLVENRHGDAPLHFRTSLNGRLKFFKKLTIKQ
jgi:hypothetical protein